MRQRLALAALAIAVLVVGAACESAARQNAAPGPTSTSSLRFLPQAGMTLVSGDDGPVGYAPTKSLMPRTKAEYEAINARTLVPVTGLDGTVVGYEAQAVGFIPLATAQRPGFDVEALRARLQGGCEPQIGDPTFEQKFPLCPLPDAD